MASSRAEVAEEDDKNTSASSPSEASRRSSRGSASSSRESRTTSASSHGRPSEAKKLPSTIVESGKMNFQTLLLHLKNTKHDGSSTLDMDGYILAYHELNKFFNMMGSIFSFVSKDVTAKIIILENYRHSSRGDCYKTLQSMIEYEKKSNLLKSNNSSTPTNGCRTLLRLHRAMEFIKVFLQRLSKAKDEEKVSTCAQEAYNSTLAKYHPWLIQKAAIVAMYSLPQKPELIRRTCIQSLQEATAVLPEVVTQISVVYNATQNLYKVNGLLDLP